MSSPSGKPSARIQLTRQIVFRQSGATKMTTTKQYDFLNRLSSITSSPSNAFTYEYNAANQRTMDRLSDGSYWRYGYDALGQVISGSKYWADETPVAGQQFDYAFDTIGNRTQTEAGGDQNGANLRAATYTNNALNQITSRIVPGYVDIMGDGIATNAVTVNGQTAYRKNEYFRQQLAVNNSSSNLWTNITVAEGGGSVSGHAYVPQTPENYSYDFDGNLLSDGRWTYAWDGENRLIGMTSLTNAPSGSQLQLAFTYDYKGRRIRKIVATNNGSAYVGEYTNNYAYDGWNCVAILNSAGLINSFMWGSDLSGSQQGAGGVGGLIEVALYGAAATNAINNTNGTQSEIRGITNGSGAATVNCFVAYDGNGNVSALINAADGTTIANYEYGPFGELLRATGPMAKLNPFRFSTKYDDDESDFLYYGYRYYSPSTGRWLSRDPAEEGMGGPNLYAMLGNETVSHADYLGNYEIDFHYYVIYYLLRAKCFSASDANSIAYASENVDDNPSTDPYILGKEELFGNQGAGQILANFHFINSTPTTATRTADPMAVANAAAALEPWGANGGDASQTGTALHTLADTWAHDGFTAFKNSVLNGQGNHPDLKMPSLHPGFYIGHSDFFHRPDFPYLRPTRAMHAAQLIYNLIPPKNCPCPEDQLSWETIQGDLQRQFAIAASEYDRSIAAQQMIKNRFGDSVWYSDHKYDHNFDSGK